MSKDTLIVIPARYASTRFPGKPLVEIKGKSMIRRVYDQCRKVEGADVITATDDGRILQEVKNFGGKALMTGDHHRSGTERVGEVVKALPQYKYVVNVQGDEPFISPTHIETLVQLLREGASIATLITEVEDRDKISDPNRVKAVLNKRGEVMYFSRSPIPFQKDKRREQMYYQHIGIYGFSKEVLLELLPLLPGGLEISESLEQLRWLEEGYRIKAEVVDGQSFSIDTPQDLEELLSNWNKWVGK